MSDLFGFPMRESDDTPEPHGLTFGSWDSFPRVDATECVTRQLLERAAFIERAGFRRFRLAGVEYRIMRRVPHFGGYLVRAVVTLPLRA